jgi:hypothetical protein
MLINCLHDLACYKIMGPSDKKRKINLIIGQNKNVMLSNKIQKNVMVIWEILS